MDIHIYYILIQYYVQPVLAEKCIDVDIDIATCFINRNDDNIYSSSFPINTLTDINVLFLYPDGTNVNFRNVNHSFVLKITEEKLQNDDTYLNSKVIIPKLID